MMNEGPQWFLLACVLFYLILYPSKLLISLKAGNKAAALKYYFVLFFASLAVLYLVFVDWKNASESSLYHWLGVPLIFLTIPTITFYTDILNYGQLTAKQLINRSLLEVLVLFPIWFIATLVIFARLGWIYF